MDRLAKAQQEFVAVLESEIATHKKQIEESSAILKQLAENYSSLPIVKEHLSHLIAPPPIANVGAKRNIAVTGKVVDPSKKNLSKHGRRRKHPHLQLEYNDGQVFEYIPNPARNLIAKLIQQHPSGSIVLEMGEKNRSIYVKHYESQSSFRLTNPIRENESGLKNLRVV